MTDDTTTNADDPVIESADFRRVLGAFPTGVTVVTAAGADGPVGVAIGSFASVSLDPPLVGFFLGTGSSSWPGLEAAGHFCVNVLGSHQVELCGKMASRDPAKFDGVDVTAAPHTGAPILPDVLAWIDCRIDRVLDGGDHHIILGRVLALDTVNEDADPMVFFKGGYGTYAG